MASNLVGRYQPVKQKKARFDRYRVQPKENLTILQSKWLCSTRTLNAKLSVKGHTQKNYHLRYLFGGCQGSLGVGYS